MDYIKGIKTKEEFRHKRLSPLYSMGESVNKSVKANRKFHIEEDLKHITFKPNSKTKIILDLEEVGKNRKNILKPCLKNKSYMKSRLRINCLMNMFGLCLKRKRLNTMNINTSRTECLQ